LGGGLGERAARRQFSELLRLEAIGAEDALDLGEFGFVGGVARATEPMGPIRMVREFLAPASEVEADFALVGTVLEAMVFVVGGVGRGARIVVKMGLLGHSGGGRILFDVEDGGAILAGGPDGLAMEMIQPHMAVDAHFPMHAPGVLRLQVLHHLGDAPFGERFEHEVYVIRHEAEGVDTNAVAAGESIEAVKVADELGAGLEDSLAAAATLVDVIDLAYLPIALSRRGSGEFPAGVTWDGFRHLLNSVFCEGKFSFIFQKSENILQPIQRRRRTESGRSAPTL